MAQATQTPIVLTDTPVLIASNGETLAFKVAGDGNAHVQISAETVAGSVVKTNYFNWTDDNGWYNDNAVDNNYWAWTPVSNGKGATIHLIKGP